MPAVGPATEPAEVALRPREPSPEPVEAVTVQVVPEPVTLVIAGVPPSDVGISVKLPATTPMTDAEKGRIEAELAREISVDVVDYREFLQGLQR